MLLRPLADPVLAAFARGPEAADLAELGGAVAEAHSPHPRM